MSKLDDKIKEYYNSKAISEVKIRNIQRKCTMEKRKSRFMFYGPIAAIFFIAIMSKIVLNFFQEGMQHPVESDQTLSMKQEYEIHSSARLNKAAPETELEPALKAPSKLTGPEAGQAQNLAARGAIKGTVIELLKLNTVKSQDANKRNIIEVRAVVLTAFPQMKEVYQKALKVSNIFRGEIQIEFTIGRKGKVKKADLVSSELKYSDLEQDILKLVKGLEFPKSKYRDINYIVGLKFSPAL